MFSRCIKNYDLAKPMSRLCLTPSMSFFFFFFPGSGAFFFIFIPLPSQCIPFNQSKNLLLAGAIIFLIFTQPEGGKKKPNAQSSILAQSVGLCSDLRLNRVAL